MDPGIIRMSWEGQASMYGWSVLKLRWNLHRNAWVKPGECMSIFFIRTKMGGARVALETLFHVSYSAFHPTDGSPDRPKLRPN